MTARLLDGTALSRTLRAALAVRAQTLSERGHPPGLAVVLVGDDPASQIYVRNKASACEAVGIRSEVHRMPPGTGQDDLMRLVERLNSDPAVDGILVQLPLPAQLAALPVIEAILIDKDVDGFHALSAGNLLTGRMGDGVGFRPCTPYGVMELLDAAQIPIRAAHAVVIGRSNTVGKPMAVMLLERDATVTICHSATRDLAALVRNADIVVAAVGRAGTVTAGMIKPGAAVVDVGMNRNAAGKLVGDVDFEPVSAVAGWITPVPGGVGPMTITMLLTNTILSAERRLAAQLSVS